MIQKKHNHFNALLYNYSGGFSLIEMMVASAIASLIMLMAYSSYRTVTASIGRLSDKAEFYENLNNALTMIDRDIANAYSRRENTKICFISEFSAESSVLNFVAVVHNDITYQGDHKKSYPASDVREVGYSLQKNQALPDSFDLIRREDLHYDDDPLHGGEKNILLKRVKHLKFELKSGNDWTDRWDSRLTNKLPNAVKTTLTVLDYENQEHSYVFISFMNIK